MAVGGSTTVPPWMQALESKYWNMCLCLRAQWWAHFKDLNNNSDGDAASPSTTVAPELHLKESCGHFADYTFLCHSCSVSVLIPAVPIPVLVLCFLLSQPYFLFWKKHFVFPWILDSWFLPRNCLNSFFPPVSIVWVTSFYVSVRSKNHSYQDFLIRCIQNKQEVVPALNYQHNWFER